MTTTHLPHSTYGRDLTFLQRILLPPSHLTPSLDEVTNDLSVFYRMNVTDEPDESGYNWVAPPKVGRQAKGLWSYP